MRFYKHDPDAFASGVARLTLEETGAYILLLGELYSRDGHLPDDIHHIARVLRCDIRIAKRIRERLLELGKLESKDGLLSNFRATSVISSAQELSSKARISAQKRWKINGAAHANAMPTLCYTDTDTERKKERARERAQTPEVEKRFGEFWEVYPHKVGKLAARKAFTAALKRPDVEFSRLMATLRAYTSKTDDRPWCNPATWLNQGRWDDVPSSARGDGFGIAVVY